MTLINAKAFKNNKIRLMKDSRSLFGDFVGLSEGLLPLVPLDGDS